MLSVSLLAKLQARYAAIATRVRRPEIHILHGESSHLSSLHRRTEVRRRASNWDSIAIERSCGVRDQKQHLDSSKEHTPFLLDCLFWLNFHHHMIRHVLGAHHVLEVHCPSPVHMHLASPPHQPMICWPLQLDISLMFSHSFLAPFPCSYSLLDTTYSHTSGHLQTPTLVSFMISVASIYSHCYGIQCGY